MCGCADGAGVHGSWIIVHGRREVQMCGCADVRMCRCADVLMCRCGDVRMVREFMVHGS